VHHAQSVHVRVGSCVDGSELARRIFTSQAWSVQPCIRPVVPNSINAVDLKDRLRDIETDCRDRSHG
jgi:hypothetical protein